MSLIKNPYGRHHLRHQLSIMNKNLRPTEIYDHTWVFNNYIYSPYFAPRINSGQLYIYVQYFKFRVGITEENFPHAELVGQ